ncbi:MAG: hypothetical protein ACFFAH_15915 [Promethearchaeota archaeon]
MKKKNRKKNIAPILNYNQNNLKLKTTIIFLSGSREQKKKKMKDSSSMDKQNLKSTYVKIDGNKNQKNRNKNFEEIQDEREVSSLNNTIEKINMMGRIKFEKNLSENRFEEFKKENRETYTTFSLNNEIEEFLDNKRDDIINEEYLPDVESVKKAISRPDVSQDYVTSIISNWIKKYKILGAKNLSELKIKFGRISKQKLLDTFLDSKLPLIRKGIYFPTKSNLNRDLPISKKFSTIQKMVSKWMISRDLPYNNVSEMMIYFKKKDEITLIERIYNFLDSKLDEINNLEYIPTYKKVKKDSSIKKFDSHYIIFWFQSRFKDNKLKFRSLTDLKRKAGVIKNNKVNQFLDSKRSQIETLEFLPTTENVIRERLEFKKIPNISKIIAEWLKINKFPSITELKELSNQESFIRKLRKVLDPLKDEIKNHDFLPTIENFQKFNIEFDDKELLREYINRWLKDNNIANNLKEYLYNIGIKSNARSITDFLDSKKQEIENGDFYPTRYNLRKFQNQIDVDINNFSNLDKIRWKWFEEKIGKSMTQLIDENNPTYKELGVKLTSHGYPPKFKSTKFKVLNATFQTVMIKNENELITFNPTNSFSNFRNFFKYLRKNEDWKFVDILTGEIFMLKDIFQGIIDLHHINFIKTDLRPENLCYLFRNNHNIITKSKYHYEALFQFITKLLQKNIESLEQNNIPKSWKVDWRIIASQEGIRLSAKRYIRRKYRSTIMEYFQNQKKIDSY